MTLSEDIVLSNKQIIPFIRKRNKNDVKEIGIIWINDKDTEEELLKVIKAYKRKYNDSNNKSDENENLNIFSIVSNINTKKKNYETNINPIKSFKNYLNKEDYLSNDRIKFKLDLRNLDLQRKLAELRISNNK